MRSVTLNPVLDGQLPDAAKVPHVSGNDDQTVLKRNSRYLEVWDLERHPIPLQVGP